MARAASGSPSALSGSRRQAAEAILGARVLVHLGEFGFKSMKDKLRSERRRPSQAAWDARSRARKGQPGYPARLASMRRWRARVGLPARRYWEAWEEQFLSDHPTTAVADLALALSRSISSVILKRQYLRRGRPIRGKHG